MHAGWHQTHNQATLLAPQVGFMQLGTACTRPCPWRAASNKPGTRKHSLHSMDSNPLAKASSQGHTRVILPSPPKQHQQTGMTHPMYKPGTQPKVMHMHLTARVPSPMELKGQQSTASKLDAVLFCHMYKQRAVSRYIPMHNGNKQPPSRHCRSDRLHKRTLTPPLGY